jgi:hypothetical protein
MSTSALGILAPTVSAKPAQRGLHALIPDATQEGMPPPDKGGPGSPMPDVFACIASAAGKTGLTNKSRRAGPTFLPSVSLAFLAWKTSARQVARVGIGRVGEQS